MRFILLSTLFLLFFLSSVHAAQDTGKVSIDIKRLKLHEDIDAQQELLCGPAPLHNKFLTLKLDTELGLLLTDIYFRQVDELQHSIEVDEGLDHRSKVKYLTGIRIWLEKYKAAINSATIDLSYGILLYDAFKEAMLYDELSGSMLSIAINYPYEVNDILFGINTIFFDSKGLADVKAYTYKQFASKYPDKILLTIDPYLGQPYADSLIISASRTNPQQFYNYASARNSTLGIKMRQIDDSVVQLLVRLSDDKSGRLIFPFMHSILKGNIRYDKISSIAEDGQKYYQLLVKTELEYMDALRKKDTPVLYHEVIEMIAKKAEELYINEINALHDEVDAVRFRVLQPLTAEELYYIIVTGEDILYTSSYTGVYNRMMEKVRNGAGDTLLLQVRFDRFRKFIKMAAGYNKLNEFLSTMPDPSANLLMKSFVRGLEKTFDLEDAVDVADSYSSINDPLTKQLVIAEVERNLLLQTKNNNKRGLLIYDILDLLTKSANDKTGLLSERYHIPPVYTMNYNDLSDSNGRVVQQVFFYGDKDGKESFNNFMGMFAGKNEWKIIEKDQWVEIRSLLGEPVWIFANLPLDNSKEDDPDAKAQAALSSYLTEMKLYPTIVIHRGHSYHLKSTISQLPSTAKIIVLGSCGGFQNLNAILEVCPQAHIVSSKEVGTKLVNEPILKLINESLRKGERVDWVAMWSQLEKQFSSGLGKERFDNYIPPHKNLGALFIKAYSNNMR